MPQDIIDPNSSYRPYQFKAEDGEEYFELGASVLLQGTFMAMQGILAAEGPANDAGQVAKVAKAYAMAVIEEVNRQE